MTQQPPVLYWRVQAPDTGRELDPAHYTAYERALASAARRGGVAVPVHQQGRLRWGKRTRMGTRQDAYRDVTIYHVPFVGPRDEHALWACVTRRLGPGYCFVGFAPDGQAIVEHHHPIGD